ncbi:MAG: hypothetical protein ABI411_06360 [Tahibacter sp.]
MRNDKNIVVIGVSEEDTAHLRLLIRQAGARLAQRWRWGSESGADLVVVDPGVFAGQMARTRALASGMRCAIVSNEPSSGPELVLHRPFKLDNVVTVLNAVGGGGVIAPTMSQLSTDEFFFDDDESGAIAAPDLLTRMMEERASSQASPRDRFGTPATGLDDVLKQDAAAERPLFRVPQNVGGETLVEGTLGPTRRSEVRMNDAPHAQSGKAATPGPNTLPPVKRGAVVDNSRHAFSDYLGNTLLRSPSQIVVDALAPLTLDPKHAVFHTSAPLAALEAYLREPQPRSAWRALTTAELSQVREQQPAQPYQRLVWLDVLLNSGGRLSPQLDPGGVYHLTEWLEVERDYRHHFRIVTALMNPAPLNEIASTSGASMEEVFDMVNAYHALGLLYCQPRASLRVAPKPADGKAGLLGKLRRPFGKK